jgi:asparagine synthase (glutamine-hydrolysing)
MCGIAGFSNYTRNKETLIRTMCDAMRHRGPDDEGYFIDENISIGMRRLSIIDLAGGHQPIFNEDRSVVAIMNGEIYNYKELRLRYCAKHTFASHTDTEVLVHLYEEMGEQMWTHLNGMFSIALYDRTKGVLFLVRDRLGIKPLYYTRMDGAVAFASEIKPLLAHVTSREIDVQSMRDYLSLMYVPSPNSMLKQIKKIEAGMYVTFDCASQTLTHQTYWEPSIVMNERITEAEAVQEFDRLLKDSIRLQLQSDVPVGTFLSGGLDSSAVVAYEAAVSNYQINTFSVGFSDTTYSELPYAKMIAEKYKTKHQEFIIGKEELISHLPKLIAIMEEPCGDSAYLPTYILSQYASASVKVILNGTGGDELFGGYKRYNTKQHIHPSLKIMRLIDQRLIDRVPATSQRSKKIRNILQYLRNEEYYYVSRSMVFDEDELQAVTGRASDDPLGERMAAELRCQKGWNPKTDYPSIFMLTDIRTYLKNDLLLLLDKVLMACSLEGRVPFLDHRLVEFALSLPLRYKISGDTNKYIMKQLLEKELGRAFVHRPKIGFGAPVHHWYDERFKQYAREILLDPIVAKRGYLVPAELERLMNAEHALVPQQVFNILCLELWFREYCDR